VYFGAQ
jgi:branched-chain amino acid transport system substrate-binding protein